MRSCSTYRFHGCGNIGRAPYVILLILILQCFACAQYAQWFTDLTGDNSGNTTCGFLSLPTDATMLARGIAGSPKDHKPTMVPLAPAAMAFESYRRIAVTHLEWLMGLRTEFAGGFIPIPRLGTIGGSARIFTAGTFQYARDINEEISDPSYVEYAITGSYAREIVYNRLAAGGSISYLESRLDGTVGRSATLDIGAAYNSDILRAHATIRNLSPGITYNGLREKLPVQFAAAADFVPLTDRLLFERRLQIDLGAGCEKTADEPLRVGVSAELLLANTLSFTTGYQYAVGQPFSAIGIGAGIGLMVDRFGASFGWRNQSEEIGSVWALTATMQLDPLLPKTALDYYNQAEKHYTKNRNRQALAYANRAIRLDPNLWRAHSLIARIKAEQRRNRGDEIAIIYTGNCQGQFLPALRADETLGGLARQVSALSQLRKEFPANISINTGNNLTPRTHKLRTELLGLYLSHTSFDIVSAAGGELGYGIERFRNDADIGTEFLSGTDQSSRAGTLAEKVVDVGGHKIYVTSYTNQSIIPTAIPAQSGSTGTNESLSRLASQLQGRTAHGSDIRVVVMHDTWNNISSFAKVSHDADVIIAVGISQRFATPMVEGKTLILSPGEAGQSIGALSIRFGDDNSRVGWDHTLYSLTSSVPPDSALDHEAHRVALEIALEEAGISVDAVTRGKVDGTLVFVSDRTGESSLYLKVAHQFGEFPLTPGKTCSRAEISFACGKLLYFEHHRESEDSTLVSMDILGSEKRALGGEFIIFDARFDPAGTWIYAGVQKKNSKQSGIVRFAADGITPHWVLPWENSVVTDLAFSPDSNLMAFTTDRDRQLQVYLCSTEGQRPIRITDARANHSTPMFSPNGRYLAYLSDRADLSGNMDLWYYDMTTGKTSQASFHARVSSYVWSANSQSIVYAAGKDRKKLFRVDLESPHDVTPLAIGDSADSAQEYAPQPLRYRGNEMIAFVREYDNGAREIWWVAPDGTKAQAIVKHRGNSWLE